jgi:hypothetical protein
MAANDDTYSAAQAAALLGVSERRVRQLAASAVLTIVEEKPLRLAALSVLAERDRRGSKPVKKPLESAAAPMDAEQIRELIRAVVADVIPLALEGRDRAEQILRDELAAARAEAEQLREQLRIAEVAKPAFTDKPPAEPVQAESAPQSAKRRRWWR